MSKKFLSFLAVLLMAAMVLAACQPAATEAPTEAPEETEEMVETEEPEETEDVTKVCQVTDVGGIDDKSFNATAWQGVLDAEEELGVEGQFLESQQQTDYEKNINAFIEEGCDLIVTVGFLLGDATQAAAEANPDQNFAIVDFAYDPPLDNVLGLVFNTDGAAFLAGYAAAGTTETGTVATFGGIPIPPVTIFMDGFFYGVQHYNAVNGTNVQVLGWNPETEEGLFTGNFESTDDGRAMGESLMDEGADIIMPVAGPVGLGTAAAAQERGNVYIIGVDTDWTVSSPEYSDVVLTSVMKNMDVAVFNAAKQVVEGTFEGGLFVGTLENEGVGLAPFHDMADMVPATVQEDLDAVREGLISGEIVIGEQPIAEGPADGLGTAENPLIWVLVPSQDTEAVLTGADDIAAAVEEQTGLVIEPLVTTDYTGAVEALCSGEAHMGALNTFNYVLANARGCAEVELASVRFGSTFYSGQVVAGADTGITSVSDLAGTTFCRPDPTSTSGWIIPSIAMQSEGLDPEADLGEIVDAGGHDAVIIAVYNGDCEAGASFVDARSLVEEEFPDVNDKVVVIAESAPIPNDNISFAPGVSSEARDAIVGVFLDLASTEEGLDILNTVYSWSGMEEVEDSFYDGFRQQLEAAGMDIEDLVNP